MSRSLRGVFTLALGLLTPVAVLGQVSSAPGTLFQDVQVVAGDPSGRVLTFHNGQAVAEKQTLATAPLSAMAPYFGLTEEQREKIEAIQKKARLDLSKLLPQDIQAAIQDAIKKGENDPEATTVTNPDGVKVITRTLTLSADDGKEITSDIKALQQRLSTIEQDREKVEKEIELVLTPTQRPAIASFLRDLELFKDTTLPVELMKQLDLNGPQKRKLQIIAQEVRGKREKRFQNLSELAQRSQDSQEGQTGNSPALSSAGSDFVMSMQQVRQRSRAVLTPAQRALVDKWEQEQQAKTQ